ncbi:MAG: acylphosphatase [Pseudomonadales bacterium]
MSSGNDLQAQRGRVEGRVQGVAFRASMRTQARRCGATGWVRNEPDGAVEFLAQGNRRALQQLLDWARHGPPGASVDAFNVREVDPDPGLDDFDVRA